MEIFKDGLVPALVLVVYTLIDKLLVPLVRARLGGEGGELSPDAQRLINKSHAKRLDQIESDLRVIRDTLGQLNTHAEVSEQLLKRIEARIP